ncbi:MAG: response regulator [Lachnospiraceae bacterium]|nr:response regulator [Lachnospiraceae bacterium]
MADKLRLLIVDDEEVNREILKEMFRSEKYELTEAVNGEEAIARLKENPNMDLVMLDIVMPIMNGFGVLEYMHKEDMLDEVPVILITSEDALDSEDQAYSYGVADVIHKPFYPHIVKRRSKNIIELYQNKRDMEKRLKEQEEELIAKDKKIRENNQFMIETLSSVVEARSAETGEHTRRIKYFTRIMMKYLMKYFPKYGITQEQIDEVSRAATLHDIGKIGVPDAILLKPGKLTKEEFEIMKKHTTIGCEILERSYKDKSSDFYRYAYNICRYHHERWDGKGYPDHLAGEDIPIYTQVVAIADVYDALVSHRVYKDAYANSVAYDMIMKGECGQFSPDVLECFALAKEDFFNVIEVIHMFDFS